MIKYVKTKTYKYKLHEHYNCLIPELELIEDIFHQMISSKDGLLIIKKNYRWDGPSGPTIHTKNFMRPSLVHDALYQLIRDGYLDIDKRKTVDKIFLRHLKEDGMGVVRRTLVYLAVRAFGKPFVKRSVFQVKQAP